MSSQSAVVVDLSEYRRKRQAENAAQSRAMPQPGALLMWCWVWFVPMTPAMHAHQA
jgi:hypothetical protein